MAGTSRPAIYIYRNACFSNESTISPNYRYQHSNRPESFSDSVQITILNLTLGLIADIYSSNTTATAPQKNSGLIDVKRRETP